MISRIVLKLYQFERVSMSSRMIHARALVLLSLIGNTLQQGCESEWTLISGYCYRILTSRNPYSSVLDAKNYCRDQGAEIGSIGSKEDEDNIFEMIRQHKHVKDLFIGFTDVESDNNFMWFDGLSYNYTNWHKDEPNDQGGPEPCSVLDMEDETWKDYPCCTDVDINTVLCKKDAILSNHTYSFNAMMSSDFDPIEDARQRLHMQLEELCGQLSTPCSLLRPCENGARCTNIDRDHYKCHCAEGYAGTHCEELINCCYPREVAHATVVGDTTRTMYGDHYMYTCEEGYQFAGGSLSETRTCNGTSDSMVGKWMPEIGDCKRIECKMLPILLSKDTRKKDYGTTVTYWCPDNGTFGDDDRNKTTTCAFDGQWDPKVDTDCIENTEQAESEAEKKYRTPVEAEGAEALGSVAIIFMVVEIVLLLLIDVSTIKDNIVFLIKNICLVCKTEDSDEYQSKYLSVKSKENGEFREVACTYDCELNSYETMVVPNEARYLPEYTECQRDSMLVPREDDTEVNECEYEVSAKTNEVRLPCYGPMSEHESGGSMDFKTSEDDRKWIDNKDFIYIDGGRGAQNV